MVWLLVFVLTLLLLAPLLLALFVSRRHGAAGLLVVFGILLIILGAIVTGWQHLVMATAVVAVLVLGVLVLFQRIPPLKALSGVLGGFLLLFPCIWLALRLGEVFLLEERPLSIPSLSHFPNHLEFSMPTEVCWPAFFCAAGLAGLVAARFLEGRMKVPVVFLCILVLLYFAPQWLELLRFRS